MFLLNFFPAKKGAHVVHFWIVMVEASNISSFLETNSDTRIGRRPVILLAFCLLVGTVAIFAIATYQTNSVARPHPISVTIRLYTTKVIQLS